MTIDYRIRNIVIAAVLAATAGLLTILYVTSAKDDEAASKQSVKVYVPSQGYAIGTAGSKIAGSMTVQVVKRDQARARCSNEPGADQGPVPDPAGDQG